MGSRKTLSRPYSPIFGFLLLSTLPLFSETICAAESQEQNKQHSIESVSATEQDKINADVQLSKLTESFEQHLAALNISPDRLALQVSHTTIAFSSIIEIDNSDLHDMQLPNWFSAGYSIPSDVLDEGTLSKETFPDGKLPVDFVSPSLLSAIYLGRLMYQRRCEEENGDGEIAKHTKLSPEELRHIHRFLLIEQIWTQQDYEIVELAVARMAAEKNNDFTTKQTFQPDIIC